jgi:hypothetical protein
VYELKVEDYDKIYANENKVEEKQPEVKAVQVQETLVVEETVQESPVTEEPIVEEVVEPVVEEPVVDEPITEDIPSEEVSAKPVVEDADNEEVSTVVESVEKDSLNIKFSRSFEANLIQADDEVKTYYSELKNLLLSYKGVKSRFSWKYDSYSRGRDQLVKLKIRGKTIYMFIALNPEDYDKARYFHTAVTAMTLQSFSGVKSTALTVG